MEKLNIKILDILYFNNLFRLAKIFINILSFFNKKYYYQKDFYHFFKKRNKTFSKDILKKLKIPKVFIFNIDPIDDQILNNIYSFKNINKKNEYSLHGHLNVYQSEHNLNDDPKYKNLTSQLEIETNRKIIQFYLSNYKIFLKKIWFVITKKSGFIQKHCHFDSDLSGVYYIKVNENYNSGLLKIYNKYNYIEIYKFLKNSDNYKKEIYSEEHFYFTPKQNDIIIFNSYVEHSVKTNSDLKEDRISIPFDLIFDEKN